MATGTAGSVAKEYHTDQIHYLRKDITYADDGKTVVVGYLPTGAVVLPAVSGAYVGTVFNGGSTNTADIGITGNTTKYASALALGTLGHIELDVITDSSGNSSITTAVEEVIATVVCTANGSTGLAAIVLAYLPPDAR